MDINKLINTNYRGKDIQNITGLKLNEDILTNVIYKIKQNINAIKNFEQLNSNVEIIINDMNIKNSKLTIDKINQFLYNQLYIDINVVDLRKNISEHFANTCPTIPDVCPSDTNTPRYNAAKADTESFSIDNYTNFRNDKGEKNIEEHFISGDINSEYIKSYPGNAWYSKIIMVDNKKIKRLDTSKCPPGLSLTKLDDGTNICTIDSNIDIVYESKINNFVENKWYEWFTIPNFHLDNTFKEITEDNIKTRLQPCGYNNDINILEFDKIPYTEFIDKCMNKIDYKFGSYTNNMPYSPIAAICLLGSCILTDNNSNLLLQYYSNILIQESIFDTNSLLHLSVIYDATKIIANITTKFISNINYNVSIPNDNEIPQSIYAFDVDKIAFAHDIALNVSSILNKPNGFENLKTKIEKNYNNTISNLHAKELIKACHICFSKTLQKKNKANLSTMDYVYDLILDKTNYYAVNILNILRPSYPKKTYISFYIKNPYNTISNISNEMSMYKSSFMRTDIPFSRIPYKTNTQLNQILNYTKYIVWYIFLIFLFICIFYIILYIYRNRRLWSPIAFLLETHVVEDRFKLNLEKCE